MPASNHCIGWLLMCSVRSQLVELLPRGKSGWCFPKFVHMLLAPLDIENNGMLDNTVTSPFEAEMKNVTGVWRRTNMRPSNRAAQVGIMQLRPATSACPNVCCLSLVVVANSLAATWVVAAPCLTRT